MASEHRAGFIAIVLTAVGTAGCTMCPDLFDYCGPVPNGSVAQNDFAVRSNGILPLRAAPSPWPRLVEDEPTPAVEPAAEDEEPVVLAGAEADAQEAEVEPVDLEQSGDDYSAKDTETDDTETDDTETDDTETDDTETDDTVEDDTVENDTVENDTFEIVEPENVDVR